jgi:hypothetical protein
MIQIQIDMSNKDNGMVAREIMTEMFKQQCFGHVTNYMGDMFSHYEIWLRAIPEGVMLIRNWGIEFVPSYRMDKEAYNQKDYNFKERLDGTIQNCGIHMVRYFTFKILPKNIIEVTEVLYPKKDSPEFKAFMAPII